jgi:peptidoglycan L-alanyl-D-glutamate endopeptidase CwlK
MQADQITLDRITKLHPKVRQQVQEMYMHANNKILGKGVRLRFSEGLRTIAEQNELFSHGRNGDKRNIVTNARGGSSYHNYGLAFDIVLLYDKDGNGTFETASWDNLDPNWIAVTEYFISQGWAWGGNFRNFKDYPHFEKTFGYSTAQLKLRMNGNYPAI